MMDEAGYDVIGSRSAKKKPKNKKSPKKDSGLIRSSSAEHLYDMADFSLAAASVALQSSRSTDNSPQVMRRSPDPVPAPAERRGSGAEGRGAAGDNPDDFPADLEQDHMYAQVVKKSKKKASQEKEKVLAKKEVKTRERSESGNETKGNPGNGIEMTASMENGREQVSLDTDRKWEVQEGEEPGAEATHTYAIVNNTSKKLKNKKARSVDQGGGGAMATENSLVGGLRRGEGFDDDVGGIRRSNTSPNPTPPLVRSRVAPMPMRATSPVAAYSKNSSLSAGRPISTPSPDTAELPGVVQRSDRARSPARHAPPPPKGPRGVAPPLTSLPKNDTPSADLASPQTAPTKTGVTSRPPAFPPPPPPLSPSPDPPGGDDDDTEDHAYAVVDQSQNARLRRKNKQAETKLAPRQVTSELVHIDSVSRPGGVVPRAPHTYSTVEDASEEGTGGTVSVPIKSHPYDAVVFPKKGSKKQAERLRKHPSLPPKQAPPPPPPAAPPVPPYLGGNENFVGGGNGPQFLFSQDYASTLIKVSKLAISVLLSILQVSKSLSIPLVHCQ